MATAIDWVMNKERRTGKLTAWHWKAAAKFYRQRYLEVQQDHLGWMRKEVRAYVCLSLIAGSVNWKAEDLVDMANRGMKRKV